MATLDDFAYVLLYVAIGIGFSILPILLARLVAPHSAEGRALQAYECGPTPLGSAWIRYTIVYYIYALVFIAFDVDILYLYPVAVGFVRGGGWSQFLPFLIFVLILGAAVVYAWGKGVFTWKRRISP